MIRAHVDRGGRRRATVGFVLACAINTFTPSTVSLASPLAPVTQSPATPPPEPQPGNRPVPVNPPTNPSSPPMIPNVPRRSGIAPTVPGAGSVPRSTDGAAGLGGAATGTIDSSGPEIKLNGELELARLVDLAAERLAFEVEYDSAALKGTVTLRLRSGVTDAELWTLTNQLLAARGFTTVTAPGTTIVSVVKSSDAAGQARLERDSILPSDAAYVTLVTRVEHREVKDIVESIKLLLSKPGGAVTALGDRGFVLVSDLRPRIDQINYVLDLLDVPAAEASIEIIPATHMKATELSGLVAAAVTTRDDIVGKKLRGKLTPLPDGSAVALTAPSEEVPVWKELLQRFDQKQDVLTVNYVPQHFAVNDVAALMEQSARDEGPRGSGDRWKVVVDELTATIIVTATPAEHESIASLLERLDSTATGARRQIKSFVIRNRPVRDVVDVLSSLFDAGVIISGEPSDRSVGGAGGRSKEPRSVLPAGAEPVTPPGARSLTGEPRSGDRRSDGPSLPKRSNEPAVTSTTASLGGDDGREVTLTADVGMNTLLAVGEPRVISQIEELLPKIDVRQPQVLLDVLFVALTDNQSREFGIELQKVIESGQTKVLLASLFGLNSAIPDIGVAAAADATPPQGGTGVVINPGDFSAVVRALERMSGGRSLNTPRLLVNNNEEATVTSVLEQPYSATNASTTVATTAFGGTQDAGTMLTIRPQIAEGDHLVLEYSIEVSSFVGRAADPALPPPRQNNTLESIVTIPDGYTVVVGGLSVETEDQGVTQVPLIGSIPVLGELFKSRTSGTTTSKFYVFLHANVLRNNRFEDLKYLSDTDAEALGVDDGWPDLEPRLIR